MPGPKNATDDAMQSNGPSYDPSLSADGRFVAFESLASNLAAGDTNDVSDIFVYDRQMGTTQRVSMTGGDTQSNGPSAQPDISADGRWIAFMSSASNLVPDDTNQCGRENCSDIFVHDQQTGITERVSVASDGTQASGGWSETPTISADGRYVAYVSSARNLVSDDTNARPNVFVHDRQTGQTERASVASDGTPANDWSDWPSISSDGRFVAFGSDATNLAAENKGGVFVRDRELSITEWIGEGFAPHISPDGRWVAFLARDAASGWIALFLYDRQTDSSAHVRPIAAAIHGRPDNGIGFSADGRWIAFRAVEVDPMTDIQKAFTDVFVLDRQTNTTMLVSVASDGALGNSGSGTPRLSADGRFVVFESNATNLVANDTNGMSDVFVHDRLTGKTERISVPSTK
jgi:Tol biopolymer transport system component